MRDQAPISSTIPTPDARGLNFNTDPWRRNTAPSMGRVFANMIKGGVVYYCRGGKQIFTVLIDAFCRAALHYFGVRTVPKMQVARPRSSRAARAGPRSDPRHGHIPVRCSCAYAALSEQWRLNRCGVYLGPDLSPEMLLFGSGFCRK